MNNLQKAAQEYVKRQSRSSHPSGKYDGPRWYPDEEEKRNCCNGVREPSRAYPWSLMTHCRTAQHVANLYNVERSDLLREAKKIK